MKKIKIILQVMLCSFLIGCNNYSEKVEPLVSKKEVKIVKKSSDLKTILLNNANFRNYVLKQVEIVNEVKRLTQNYTVEEKSLLRDAIKNLPSNSSQENYLNIIGYDINLHNTQLQYISQKNEAFHSEIGELSDIGDENTIIKDAIGEIIVEIGFLECMIEAFGSYYKEHNACGKDVGCQARAGGKFVLRAGLCANQN